VNVSGHDKDVKQLDQSGQKAADKNLNEAPAVHPAARNDGPPDIKPPDKRPEAPPVVKEDKARAPAAPGPTCDRAIVSVMN
jgi:hypothetical protein